MFIRNKNTATSSTGGGGFASRLLNGGIVALSLLFILMASEAQAATPTAGTVISNQATATYTDTAGVVQVATSNTVQTTILPVGAYTLLSDNIKKGAANTTVYMPHVLTNTGNVADNFTLTLPAYVVNTDISSYTIFADANGDGVPDGTTPICTSSSTINTCTTTGAPTGILAPNGKYSFVVAMTIAPTADTTTPAVPTIVVTATPAGFSAGYYTDVIATSGTTPGTALTNGDGYNAAGQKINTDTITLTAGAAIAATKSIIGAYLPLTYTAPGSGVAATWSQFQPGVTTGPPGTKVVHRISYTNTGLTNTPVSITDAFGTATSSTQGYTYVAGTGLWSDTGAGAVAVADGTNNAQITWTATGLTQIDVTIKSVAPNVGANVSGYIEFQVVVKPNNAATGSIVGYTTTNNVASYNDTAVFPGLCALATATCTPTNYTPFVVTGLYSVIANNDPNSITDGDNVTAAGKDLVATSFSDGVLNANGSSTYSFTNNIHNTSNVTDSFNIFLGQVTAGLTAFPTGTTFEMFKSDGVTPLADNNSDSIPDTGDVASQANYQVIVKATLPKGANITAGPFTISKTAVSVGDASKSNTVFDQLTAAKTPGLTLTTNGLGQIYPGGTIVYPHSLVNNGSVDCGVNEAGTSGLPASAVSYTFTVTNSMSATNWQYTLYRDSNSNGVIDSTDQILGGGTAGQAITVANSLMATPAGAPGALSFIAPNNSVPILVKVVAPAGATAADIDTVTVTVATQCSGATVTSTNIVNDKTTITLSELRLIKTQSGVTWTAVNGCGAGAPNTPPLAATFLTTPIAQKPGDCIWYRIVATNEGSKEATAVKINDSTPAFTTYNQGVACTNPLGTALPAPAGITATAPVAGSTGAVSCATWTNVPPAAKIQMDFAVRINP